MMADKNMVEVAARALDPEAWFDSMTVSGLRRRQEALHTASLMLTAVAYEPSTEWTCAAHIKDALHDWTIISRRFA